MTINKAFFMLALTAIIWQKASVGFSQSTEPVAAANVKEVEAEELTDFSGGYAMIRKGIAFAVINEKGDFVIPYGKYRKISEVSDGYVAVVAGRKAGLLQLVDDKVHTIVPVNKASIMMPNGGYVLFADYNLNYFFKKLSDGAVVPADPRFLTAIKTEFSTYFGATPTVRSDNVTVTADSVNRANPRLKGLYPPYQTLAEDFREGLIIRHITRSVKTGNKTTQVATDKYGYFDFKSQQMVPGSYAYATPFSEGLAVVGERDVYGQWKFGFIDRSGKLVIPYKFSKQPGAFHGGYAVIIPIDQSEFEYGYITPQDQLGMSLTRANNNSSPHITEWAPRLDYRPHPDRGGYFLHLPYLEGFRIGLPSKGDYSYLPSVSEFSGNPLFKAEYVADNLKDYSNCREFLVPIATGSPTEILLAEKFYKQDQVLISARCDDQFRYGAVDLLTRNKVLKPSLSVLRRFDRKSGLAFAKLTDSKSEKQGYVNWNGQFAIVAVRGSKL